MLVIKEEGYLDKNHQYELPEVCLSVANMKPCVADSVFTLTGAVWAALILFTITFHVCPFCYSVNMSRSGKHLEANQPHQRRAIAHNETCEILRVVSIAGGTPGAVWARMLSGCRQSLAATLLTLEELPMGCLLWCSQKELPGINRHQTGRGTVSGLKTHKSNQF